MSSSTDHSKRCDETEDFKTSFHVVIVGAGLVGLGTAILLRKGGFKVTVLEKDLEMREVGFEVCIAVMGSLVTDRCRCPAACKHEHGPC